MNPLSRTALIAASLALVVALVTSDALGTQILLASYDDGGGGRGVTRLQLGGPTDGANLGNFTTGFTATGAVRRMAFGADRNSDGHRDLYLGTEVDAVRVFNGLNGQHITFISSDQGLRQIAVDPSNNDLYTTGFNAARIGRFDASGNPKPGTGQSGFTFAPADNLTFAVAIGPDSRVYVVDAGVLRRYDTSGTPEKSVTIGGALEFGAMNFGPDLSGDGKPELYLSNFAANTIDVIDVLTNPSTWATLTDAVTGLSTPIGFNFIQGDMYIAENGAGRISRYDLVGTTWVASPSPGNLGATFALLTGVQDVTFIPEPSVASLVLVGFAGMLIRRKR